MAAPEHTTTAEGLSTPMRGIYAPIPTPFEVGEVSLKHLRANLERWGRTRLAGLVVLGTNGEACLLDEDEKVETIAFVCEHAPVHLTVMAGTGQESTRATIRLTRKAAQMGAKAALVLNPHYYKGSMTEEALRRHYWEVADASPIPVLLYNMPRNTGLNMSAALAVRLAEHPNIVGIKDSSGDVVQMAQVVAGAKAGFTVFAGSGSFLLPALSVGAVGGTLAVANVIADTCAEIQSLFEAGRIAEAADLQRRIIPLNAAVTARWGVAGLKAAMDLSGYWGGLPRPPLLPVGDEERKEIARLLQPFLLLTDGREG